ncbi:glycosyltransferase [Marinihelvus fidelis]|uniref:glycosyltransferase n=1 Tax=Marinihelvus fidelis TaxID=2613842 RepID=UPI00177AF897|nr:glycosyltransferase [Marinihelvus fidelis]
MIFIHGGGQAVTAPMVEALSALGVEVFSTDGVGCSTATGISASSLSDLCAHIGQVAPGRGLVIMTAGLQIDAHLLETVAAELDRSSEQLQVATAFSNARPGLNPYAGLPGVDELDDAAAPIALLSRPRRYRLNEWPTHFAALSAAAVRQLAEPGTDTRTAVGRLNRAGGTLELFESWFVRDTARPLSRGHDLEPHETPRAAAWGHLGERLRAWAGADQLLDLPLPGQPCPTTLHITHSWGGGVATWVAAMIQSDDGVHLQLRSEAAESGQGAGQKLGLYLGNRLAVALDEWWLQPAVHVTDTNNPQYRAILDDIMRRFGIDRVIISSLVGHSLDAFDTGLPTIQVLHDHFPAWPLLAVHPNQYDGDLEAALEDPRATEPFGAIPAEDWRDLAWAYAQCSKTATLVAPSQSVVDIQSSLDATWAKRDIRVIGHGMPPLPGAAPVAPRDRSDGRLRLVVAGRVQDGKGARLLEQAIAPLTALAQVYLVGTGKGGERFFGRAGVNVIIDYRREDLPTLMADIGPHLALLPSVVPETFNYTLSELQALGIPTLATRLGSFPERIIHGETGWLFRPSADDLVEQLESLAADRSAIDAVRANLVNVSPTTMTTMVADYRALLPASMPSHHERSTRPATPADIEAGAWRDLAGRRSADIASTESERQALADEVRQRTAWAETEKRQRAAEAVLFKKQIAELQAQLDTRARQVAEAEDELITRARHIEFLDRDIVRLTQSLEQLRDEHAAVLGSHSWRLTAPLRVSRRVLANARRARAWNPARWPWLTAQLWRNLSTAGLGGTLRRMQHFESRPAPVIAPPTVKPLRPVTDTSQPVTAPAAVPCSDTPRVSIIIPAYRHFEATAACLASLAETRCDAAIEIIVADDASGDDSVDKLAGVEGLRLIAAEDNLGFIGNCNRAAEQARGEFVCFLNNDTEVLDGWLDALLDTFERFPDTGIAGARLVYPDGTLQECGGLIFSDGSGWNYGRGDDPSRPEYQYPRECDYVSGACLLVHRDLWQELGGFDSHYAPAYYEDTDLAFRVRERGLKVYVQPAATVIHHEGVSSGTDIGSGVKRYQAVNREKFLERWADELAQLPAPLSGPEDRAGLRRARDHRLRGRVLLVDAYTPEPDQDSGSVRLTALMRCLRDMGYGVTFFADNRAHAGRYTQALQADGIETWYDPWLRSPGDFLREHGADFGHIIVSRHYVAVHYLAACRKWAPGAKFIFDTVDLHYLREQRLAELEDSTALKQTARMTRRAELAVIRDADATIVVSDVERGVLAEDAPGCPVFILSNIHEVRGHGAGFEAREDLYFVGGYQHPPNIDAATWFVEDIWPRVRAELPDVRFHLVGSKATPEVEALGTHEGVRFHGFVDSLDPFLDGCRLSVAPLRYGAGVKGKVNQAMAHGQPVVATSVAIEGIHAEDGRDVLVADDAEAFAAAVVRLYRDPSLWQSVADGGIANVEANFSTEAARRDVETLFGALDKA